MAPPTGVVRTIHRDGITTEIISEVRAVSRESAGQTARLAEQLRGATPAESCANVYRFVRKNIAYQLDPPGKQFIKTPAATIGSGYCDCKGYAILTNDLLRCLGIRSAFRFVSFSRNSQNVTHVYSVAWPQEGGPLVVLDACLPRFNQEKPYTYHEDHMTEIIRVSGIGQADRRRTLRPGRAGRPGRRIRRNETPLGIHGFETNEEMTLKLMRQGAEVERNTAARVMGIGSVSVGDHQAAVDDYTEALAALHGGPAAVGAFLSKLKSKLRKIRSAVNPLAKLHDKFSPLALLKKKVVSKAPNWVRSVMPQVNGVPSLYAYRADREERRIGFLKKVFKKVKAVAKKAGGAIKKAAKATGKVVVKAAKATGKAVVKAGKFALKVATLPMRLLAKGVLEVFLPKMAPMFLYLFVTNQSTIASLPAAAARKRKKALSFARFITNTIGMKEAHFLKIVRTGIQRKMGGTPEQILAKSVKGPISGIGVAPLLALVPMALDLIKKLASVFGKKASADETPSASDMPDPEADFEAAPAKVVRKVQAHAATKPASQRGEEPDTYTNEMAQEAEEAATQYAVDNEPADTPVDAPLPEPDYSEAEAPTDYADESTDYAPGDDYGAGDEYASAEEGEPLEEEISGIGNYL
ncbi:transglutaminase domain-containing protein [Hymenobacter sp. ASUV-10]|uniref:Transglutaminase domain-containing protein n=1 Tax=Hymenobacter aranciens TaxID=3063996 RepID=A0ABT9B5Y0_9BACT|nr:transglutaminase-like domain-containing protein [Hymenobacter sp. ASUV-10]MDO7873676.1 transglutaminase domain-containing protein [Hymenobacter sp. ASUV-10]